MRFYILLCSVIVFSFIAPQKGHAESGAQTRFNPDEKRMELFKEIEKSFDIPWYYIAAIDQYEHSIRNARKDLPDSDVQSVSWSLRKNGAG